MSESPGATGNSANAQNLSVTMGQSKIAGDIIMSAEDKKSAKPGEQPKNPVKVKAPNSAHETLEVTKNIPQARFGHTITMVNKYKVVLFGGATGDTGKYSMTGETFIFNLLLKQWTELSGKFKNYKIIILLVKGVPPSPRAAHASTNVEQMQMVVYGGATGGGSLASDDLYLLDMRNGEDQA